MWPFELATPRPNWALVLAPGNGPCALGGHFIFLAEKMVLQFPSLFFSTIVLWALKFCLCTVVDMANKGYCATLHN